MKLYLPRYTGDIEREKVAKSARNLPLGNIQEVIVVAEDDATVRRMTVDSLRDLGYTVHHADGGAQAARDAPRNQLAVHRHCDARRQWP